MGSNCCKCKNGKKSQRFASNSSNSSEPWTRGGKDDPLAGERFSSSTQRGAVTLTVRNATVEDTGRYALTAHNDTGQARSDILLEVRTRPGDVPVFLRRLNDLAVKVGTRTRFLVEIRSPTQVKVSWEQEGKPVLEGERFHLLHEGNFFCVDVAPVTLEDAGLWMCRAHNSNGAATCFCHLNVLVPKAYKAPHFIEELVAILTEQGTVSLECKVVGVPTPTLKWFKDNQEIKAGDVFALSANPQDSTSLGTYTCEATNCMGKAYSTSKVHVINKEGTVQPVESLVPRGPPPVFSKELQNEKAKIGGKLTLVSKVKVPPWPKSICWFNKEGVVESGGRYHVMEDGLGAYSVEVSPVEATDEGQWKCVATSNAGNKTISACSVSVNYPKNYKKPKFLESLKAILTEEGLVSFECKVVGFPTPQLRWFKDGQELKPGDVYQLTGTNSLGSYCCIAKNCMGETSSTAELTVEDIQSQLNEEERLQLFSTNQPPSFVQGLKSIEVKINDPFRFTVQVSVSPQPSVSWYRDDEEVQDSDRVKKEQETKGVCHLSFKRLDLADQAEWKCVATNDYGQSVTSCFLKLNVPRHYKKPRFLENLQAILSEEGAVNLECKVIGVPQPTLKWYKDGRELKPGDIHRIISGQDGTCCLGTYTCEATNCMGTVASSASLLGFEDRGQVKPPVPRPLPPPAPLVRQPSLSTIQEERTSQMHDTMTLDERAEVSFSFDGKEVSVSLYETPDLTEEEALQVVEMYAEELSEHISEHNVIELPPMRFVKETSKSGNLLMEAVVIDVSPDYYASAEDRTEADLDEFSITEDNNGFMSPAILSPEEMPFEKFTADFLERTLQSLPIEQKPAVPVKPPRKRGAGADASDSSYHSFKEAKVSSPEEESSDAFLDALSSEKDKSPKESLIVIESGSGAKEVPKLKEEKKLSISPPHTEMEISQEIIEKSSESKKLKKKSRSRSKSAEIQPDESSVLSESKPEKNLMNKRKSSDSEKEDDSLREFEKRKSLKMLGKQECVDKIPSNDERLRKSKSSESEKEDDSLQEYENRKSLSRSEKISEKLGKVRKHTSDESGKEDDSLIEYEKSKMSSDGSLEKLALKVGRPKFPLSKSMSTESSEKDDAFALKSEVTEQTLSRKKRKKSVKKTGSLEKKDDGQGARATELPPSSEAESFDREPLKHKKVVSTSDLDRMRSMSDLESVGDKSRAHEDDEDRSADFDTAEDSAYDKSEMSVLESLNHSIQEIQKGLAAVEEKIISESSEEPQSAKSSLSIIDSLAQPIKEIQKSLVEVERLAEETEAGHYSPSSILETLKEPIEELSKNLAVLEQTQEIKTAEESLLKKTGLSLLESVSQPLQELHKELSFIQQQAVIETGDETFSEILQSFKPSLLVVEGGVEQSERELSSKMEDLTDVTSIPQPTFAHSVQDSVQSVEIESCKQISSAEKSDSILPMTVQELEVSFADTTVKSLSVQKDATLKEELNTFSSGLDSCLKSLKDRAQGVDDNEIKDILLSASNLINPLDQFKTVLERCLMLVVESDKSANPQVQSANIALKSALQSPIQALGNCMHLLEALAQAKNNQEVRGLGIKMLFKLSFPLEELKTTMKLVENLSEHTCIELLVAPVENLTATVSMINPETSKEGFAENISKEGIAIVRDLDTSLGNLSKSLSSMSKVSQPNNPLVSLSTLSKPILDLQKSLHKLENKMRTEESQLKTNKSETHSLAQDLCKPLQAIRTELSLAQHEIELETFTNLSTDVSQGDTESPTSVVNQSLEQVYKSVLTCTEFILSKSPDETLHLRYLLFALNELITPVNELSTSITRSEQLALKEKPKLAEADLSMQPVTASVKELLETLSFLREHSSSFISQPESSVVQAVCAMSSPLQQVENGLHRIIGLMHEEDKRVLNINLLKTMAEPFKCLQKSMINVSEKLESGLLSQEIFLELKQPIQELQRSILIIQDQVSFEYGDEPASIESNIVTLQSLVHPLNSLKKHFLAIESLLSEQTYSTSHSKGNNTLHSIMKASHDLQLKVSSIMVQDNYLSKHSLDSLEMFPIFQELSCVLRDFENTLKRVDLVSQNITKPDVIFHNRLAEAVSSFKIKVTDLQNKIVLASNKAIKDKKHPVHYLKKGTGEFLHQTTENLQTLVNSELDENSLAMTTSTFFTDCAASFKELSNHLVKIENMSEQVSYPDVKSGRDSTDISTISSSDTIKDVNTIMEEITQSRILLESEDIPFVKSPVLVKELQILCDYLKTAEEVIVQNTVMKSNSLSLSKEEERKALIKTFSGMKAQLGKVETNIHDNPQALESLRLLKYTLEVIQEHLSFGEEISEIYILQNLSGPLKAFRNCVNKESEESLSLLKPTESVSVYLERFEKSTSDLELGLMKLEHALLNSTGDFSSLKNIDIDVLAHPIEELVQYIHTIEEQSSIMSETLRDQSSLSMLKTLALPIQEIKEGVLEIQEQILFESSGQPPSRKSCASILYEIAKPIRELRSGVALIQEQAVIMEADLEPLSDETAASSLKTLAVPIEELKRVLETFVQQRPIVFEPEAKSMSEDISLLKTIAKPVKELQSKLAAIEMNQLMEGNVESFTVKENLLALAKPIHVLRESITQFENKIILETLGDDISVKTDISLIKRVAKPLLELAKGIAMISEQQVVEAADLEDNTLSELSTLANITDVSMESAVLNVNEPIVLEQGLSLKEDVHIMKQAKAIREDHFGVAVTEVQQVVCEAAVNLEKGVTSKEKAFIIVEETCSPLVAEQQIVSQIDSLSIDSNSKQLAEVKDVTLHEGLQAEIQEPISAVSQLTSINESLTLVQELSGSLNIAAQVDVQQALSEGVTFVNETSLNQPTKVKENITPAFGVQGELQQSLADVESIETEEDTLKSISIQETSFKLEPLVQMQQALSIAESLTVTEKTLTVADVKTDLKEALQNEAQQVMSFEGDMKSFGNVSDTAASIGDITPQVATNVEMQQVMSTVENLQTVKEDKQIADASQVALAEAVQVEQQDLISNVESLSEFTIAAKQSQAVSLEEAYNVAIKTEIEEFFSVAENIRKATEEIKAKIVFEPSLSESAHEEIQKVLNFSNNVQSMKENLQLMSIEMPPLLKATKMEVQEVLTACKSIQTSLPHEMKTGIESEVEQIMSSAQNLESIQQSISAKLSEEDGSIFVQVGKEKSLPLSENVAQLDTQDKPSVCAGIVSTEADLGTALETEIQAFISLAESINTVKESLDAKVTTEPILKRAVQLEIQQFLSAADEVLAVKNKLEAKTSAELSLSIATQAEIQQVMTACAHLESAKEALVVKSSTEQKFKAAIQSEIQQIFATTETLREVQKGMTAKLSQEEAVKLIEGGTKSLSVSAVKVIDNSSNICQADITTEVSTLEKEMEKDEPSFEIIPPLIIQTQIDEFIEAASSMKKASEALQAKAKIEPELKLVAIQEIQQISTIVESVQILSHSLQAKTTNCQEQTPHQTTQFEVQEVLDACEDLQKATVALKDKVNKDLTLQTAIQSEMQQILDTAEVLEVVKKTFTATENQVSEKDVSKTGETVVTLKTVSKAETVVPDSKAVEAEQECNIKKDSIRDSIVKEPMIDKVSTVAASIISLEAVTQTIPSDDVCEILTAVENLGLVSETLKSIISKDPSLKEGLETHIQQIMLTSENLQAVKPALANISSEPSALTTVKLEIQQILIAEENLNVIKDVLQAKSISEPQLQIANIVLPQLLQSADSLQESCVRLQDKNLLDTKTTATVDDKTKTVSSKDLNIATQNELCQTLSSVKEIQNATDSAEAICTHELSTTISAKKSSVASFIKEESSKEEVSSKDLLPRTQAKKDIEDKILEHEPTIDKGKEVITPTIVKESASIEKTPEKQSSKEEHIEIKPAGNEKLLDTKNGRKDEVEITSKLVDTQKSELEKIGKESKTEITNLDSGRANRDDNQEVKETESIQVDKKSPVEVAAQNQNSTELKTDEKDKEVKSIKKLSEEINVDRKKSKDEKVDNKKVAEEIKTVNLEKSLRESLPESEEVTPEKDKPTQKQSKDGQVDDKKAGEEIETVKVDKSLGESKPESEEVTADKFKPKRKKSKDEKVDDVKVVDETYKTKQLADVKDASKAEEAVEEIKSLKTDESLGESKAESVGNTAEKDKPKRKKSKDGKVDDKTAADEIKIVNVDKSLGESKPGIEEATAEKDKPKRKKSKDEKVDDSKVAEEIKTVNVDKSQGESKPEREEITAEKDKPKQKKAKDEKVEDKKVLDTTNKTKQLTDVKDTSKAEDNVEEVKSLKIDKSLKESKLEKSEEITAEKDKPKQKTSNDGNTDDKKVVDVSKTEQLTDSKVISKAKEIVDEIKTLKIDETVGESKPKSEGIAVEKDKTKRKKSKDDDNKVVDVSKTEQLTDSKVISKAKEVVDEIKTLKIDETVGESKPKSEGIAVEKDKTKRKKSKDDDNKVVDTSKTEQLTDSKDVSKAKEIVEDIDTLKTKKSVRESKLESEEMNVLKDKPKTLKDGKVDSKDAADLTSKTDKTAEDKQIIKAKEEVKENKTGLTDQDKSKGEKDKSKNEKVDKKETVERRKSKEANTDDKEILQMTTKAEQVNDSKEKVKTKEVVEELKVEKEMEKSKTERKRLSDEKVDKKEKVETSTKDLASTICTEKEASEEKIIPSRSEEADKTPKRKMSKEVKVDKKDNVGAKLEETVDKSIQETVKSADKVKAKRKTSIDLKTGKKEVELTTETEKIESKSEKQNSTKVAEDFKTSTLGKSKESSDPKEMDKLKTSTTKSGKYSDEPFEKIARKPKKSPIEDSEIKNTYNTEVKASSQVYNKKDIVDSSNYKDSNQSFEERQTYKKSEVQTSSHRSRRQNRLYIDESSTSDYSSESCSESTKIKKSTSFDRTQWEKELLKKDSNDDSYSLSSSTQRPVPKKHERKAVSPVGKISYHRKETETKPLFCGRLVDRTAALGSKVKVTCSLVGKPDPTVQWYKDGLPLNTSEDTRLHTSLSSGLASLEISELKLGDAGRYTCMARNMHGEASTTASIKIFSYLEAVPQAPVFSHQIKDQYKSASDELTVECRVKGSPQPSISWYKDDQLIPARSRFQQTTLADGTCRLVIHGPEASDSGQYKCVAENEVLTETISGYVLFEGREKYLADILSHSETKLPRFTNIVTDHKVREGGTVALQVAIKGTPRAEVTWYRGSEPLPKKSSRFRYLEDSSTGVYSLVMSDTSKSEAGIYTCRASNAHGYRDHTVKVEIVSVGSGICARGRPAMFVTRPDTSMSLAVGEDISVSFRVSGDPKPQVTWMKNMKDITNNIRTLKETVNDYVRLSLKHANVMDAGTYFMMAKNVYGTDYAFVTVKVKQRARSLTPTGIRTLWSAPETSTILRDIHEVSKAFANELPGRIEGEATVSDSGKNWLSLTWAKPENRGAAPILAYRVEAWRLGSEGGAQWSELGITPINSFDAFFLQPGGEYKFRITPRNRYGWGESVTNSEPITVGSASNFAPDIVRDLPGPIKALQGDDFTLECEVAGDPRPDIEWLKDGLSISLVKSLEDRVFVSQSQLVHRLIIKQLTADDSGRYVCEATNKLGKTSTFARLLVVSDPCLLEADKHLREGVVEDQELAPQFTMRLRDRRVQASYPVRLSCQVIGNPAPAITWACNNQPITSSNRYQLLSEADHFYTLEISKTELGDVGEYTVSAQNHLGAVSCCCQLTVDKGIRAYIAPYFTSQLEPSVTVREAAELRLFAQVEAYPSVGIAWQKDGVRLRPSRRLVVTVDPDGRVELALAHLTSRDAGLYTCTSSNIVGRSETSCQVYVTGGSVVTFSPPAITSSGLPYSQEPKFVVKPRSTEAVEGDTVIISCEVVGDPQPEVLWLRDWLKPDYYRDSSQFRQVAGGAGAQYTLEIPQVKLDFTGTYCVIARNTHGEAKAIISLQIYAKGQGKESSMVSGQVKHGKVETLPEIKRGLKDLRCCDGDSATLECLVSATPPPSVRWEKDGRILPLGEDVEAEVEGELARLRIRKVYPEDEGQYSCVAYNSLGRAVTSACLVVDVPEEKEHLLSQQLTRPSGFLSAHSTPRSTPRHTPSPSPGRSITPLPSRFREFSSPSLTRAKRIKMASPKFYTVPHNRIAEEGETVRFQCAVAGHPIPWASWDKDGHIVTPGARLTVAERDDLRTLELREVTVDDAGLYRVTLENEMGSIEATARLDVIGRQGSRTRSVRAWSGARASPTFGRRLVGSAARVGGTFTLSCDAQASPSPATSWYRNGEMVVMTERAVPSWDGRVARLELRDLRPEDGGVYTCVAENCVGTTQCAAELQVLEQTDPSDTDLRPPVFLQGLQSELTVEEGQPIELQTRLQGSSPLEVVWVKDGVEIPDCEDFRYVDYGDGRFGLRIADIFIADSGLYNCEAFNDHGDAITSGHLIVLDGCGTESPRTEEPEICFTKTPSPVLVSLRGNATFCARLQSRPLSHTSFTWSVGGRTVTSDSHRFQVTNDSDSSVLEVRGVQSEDVGQVTCVARVCSPGVPPSTVSCSTHLSLDTAAGCPATLLRGPSDTTAMRGDRVLLKAIYRGNPEPSVRWLKAGRELQTEGRVQINSRDGVSCLTISSITADDSGKYVVSVENIHGADCHYASVAVEGPPEPPAGRPSVATAGDAVTVAWSSPAYDGGCVLTGYQVEMRTSDSQEWRQVADRCHSLSHVVRGLETGQTYVFRVKAENIHGASESSVESFPFTFHTPVSGSKEEESDSCLESRQVSLEPGEEFLLRYSVHEELGKGRYGVVNKVTDLITGQTLAAKFVRCIKKQDREKVQEEIDIMNCLRHPKLLQLTAAFENPKDIVMVMEYISGGELFERVVADDFTLTERDCILFLRQICEGVSYMHKNNVVHLDLKPENIMCHTRTSHRIKIIDFGLAQKFESNTPVRVLFGTPEFIPPEIINYEPIGTESDMWSVGVICYVLLSGLSPFMGDNDAETFANITRADYDFDDEAFDAISQDAKDFISSLLLKRQEKRLTADECLRHKWMTQCDTTMNCIKLSTDKLKKFIIRRKWQKTGNAIRALGRMATLSAASRRNSHTSSVGASPRASLATSRMSSLGEGEESLDADVRRARVCSERSDSGISDCSSITARPLQHKKYSICEEPECESRYNPSKPLGVTNKLCASTDLDITTDVSVTAKKRSTNSLRPFSETTVKAPSPTLQKDAKLFTKNENFQKAFAFWKQ